MRLAMLLSVFLTGCAYYSPQRHVSLLDTTTPKYAEAECVQARDEAMKYDDKMAERVGAGVGLGRVGPVGLAAAIKLDMDQHSRRQAAKAKVDTACK